MFTTQAQFDTFVSDLQPSTDETKAGIANAALNSIAGLGKRKNAVEEALQLLPAQAQQDAIRPFVLPLPTKPAVDRLWILIVGALIVLIFFLFTIATQNSDGVKNIIELVKSTISIALGAIVGLVAPGAVKAKS